MTIKVKLYTDKNKANITGMVKDVQWSGDVNSFPRTVDISLKNTNDINKGKRLFGYSPGNTVILFDDDKEIFRGTIFKTSLNEIGDESFTAYDELVYVTKNNNSVFIKNKTASEVITAQCKKFGIKVGSIEKTSYTIPKLFCDNKSLSDIFIDVLEEERKHAGNKFLITSKKGAVYMTSRSKAMKLTIKVANVITASKETSIEEVRNQVMVTKGSLNPKDGDTKFASVTVSDSTSKSKYGTMQHVETADDDDSTAKMKKKAEQLLKELKYAEVTNQIEFIGDTSCVTGNIIDIEDDLSGLKGRFYITSDTHTWSNGVHKMSLQLSKDIGDFNLDNGENDHGEKADEKEAAKKKKEEEKLAKKKAKAIETAKKKKEAAKKKADKLKKAKKK